MRLPVQVTITEVGPRDGLQGIPDFIDTADKVRLVNMLADAGFKRIEATSFVHPGAVPQMRDAAAVMGGVLRKPGVRYCVLVPNVKGARLAIDAGAEEINFVVSASESHNQRNVNKTITQSLEEFEKIGVLCATGHPRLKATVATAFGCPFEGKVELTVVRSIVSGLIGFGAEEIVLADTAGMGNPVLVQNVIDSIRGVLAGDTGLAVHFHNKRGIGLVNAFAALLAGVECFETSVAGLGGCPCIPEQAGNVATEDFTALLHDMGVGTGVDQIALMVCVDEARRIAKRSSL